MNQKVQGMFDQCAVVNRVLSSVAMAGTGDSTFPMQVCRNKFKFWVFDSPKPVSVLFNTNQTNQGFILPVPCSEHSKF